MMEISRLYCWHKCSNIIYYGYHFFDGYQMNIYLFFSRLGSGGSLSVYKIPMLSIKERTSLTALGQTN